MEQKSNKEILADMYRHIIRDLRIDLLDVYVHDDYIQHSPMLPDGKVGLLKALTYLKAMPKSTSSVDKTVIAKQNRSQNKYQYKNYV